jgi:hypothetical protein
MEHNSYDEWLAAQDERLMEEHNAYVIEQVEAYVDALPDFDEWFDQHTDWLTGEYERFLAAERDAYEERLNEEYNDWLSTQNERLHYEYKAYCEGRN